jgi:hypothetical protein
MSDENKPNWKEWKHMPEVQVWQACALSLDIEPSSIKWYPRSWETGPYSDQLFEDESFQSENEKKEFKSRQRILLNNLNSKENSLWFSPNLNRPNLGEVSLPEFAAWCSSVEWSIPEELATLAKNRGAETVAHIEKQEEVLPLEKVEEEDKEIGVPTNTSPFDTPWDEALRYQYKKGEPNLKKGKNKIKLIEEWIAFQAKKLYKEGDSLPTLAEKIWELADRWDFQSERGPLSQPRIKRLIPAGSTGGVKYR